MWAGPPLDGRQVDTARLECSKFLTFVPTETEREWDKRTHGYSIIRLQRNARFASW